MLASAHYCKYDRFRIGEFCVWHKVMFVRRNVTYRTAVTVQAVRFQNVCSWIPHYMQWERISILTWTRFTNSVPCMLTFLRTFGRPDTKRFALVARKFLFFAISSSFLGFTGIHFRKIRPFLVILSGCHFIESQFNILNEQIQCLYVRMNYFPSSKMSYCLRSVDKICIEGITDGSLKCPILPADVQPLQKKGISEVWQ